MNSLVLVCIVCVPMVTAWVQEMENPGLYQGDMVLSPQELEQAHNGTFAFSSLRDLSTRWPNAAVPYVIHKDLNYYSKARAAIKAAIDDYHKYTCLKFVPRTDQREYIEFYKGAGCSSRVGYKKYTKNRVSLSSGCWTKATAMHEIGHSLGLHHEQTRPDRDSFVKIEASNIHRQTMFNFEKEKSRHINSYGTPYDYLSMMHYSWNAFAIDNTRPSIRTLDPKFQYHIGQETGLSQIDAKQLNLMYSCSGSYPQPPEYAIVPGCHNTGGACEKIREEGNCKSRSWRTYVTKSCRRSCGLCGGEGVTPTDGPVITYTPKPNTPKPQTPKPTPKPQTPKPNTPKPTDCYDKHINCYRFSRRECLKHRYHFEKNCKKSCGFC